MSRPNFAAITQAYRDAHPEVDWATNQVFLSRDENGDWYASGHRVWEDLELNAILAELGLSSNPGGRGEQSP